LPGHRQLRSATQLITGLFFGKYLGEGISQKEGSGSSAGPFFY
jgi:hypothetical protein